MPLFDTGYLIDLTNGDPGAVTKAKQIDCGSDVKAISVVTVHEYLRGVFYYHMDKKTLKSKLSKALIDLAHFEQLDYTAEVAREAARIDASLFRQGTKIPFADVIIAATAKHHNLPLITRDSHFDSVSDLIVIDY
ncbi:MAG: type II toxin-antitoxin system VapC family toxin [Candidatus Thorarchaeota archaeon]|nr:type II toxin-antitoxin system VapC family toxin [Candidatus Thorarchaeota archaeon]